MRKITRLFTLMMMTVLTLTFVTTTAQQFLNISNKAPQEARFSEFPVNYSKIQYTSRNIVFSEDFESGTFPPSGWTKIDFHANPTSNWHEDTDLGNTFPQVLYNDANLMDEWLITPSLDLTSYTDLQLRFSFFTSYYWLVDPFDGADFMVKVSTDGGTNWTQIWVEEDYGVFSSYVWYDVVLPFNAYAGMSNVKIAFHWYGDDGAQTRFDDVILEEPPTCPPPTGLYASDILSTEANIGWTPGGSEVLWNVEVGAPGFTPGTSTEIVSEYGTGDNPILIKDLTQGTTYEVYVQADCGASEVSSWTGPVEFTTLCLYECPIGGIAETEACGDTINNGCNLVINQTFELVDPGDTICGTVWAEGGFRDTDWFELMLAEPTQVILHAYAETELVFGSIAGIDPSNPDCADVTGVDPFDVTEICTPVSLDLGILVAGTHWIFAALPVFEGYPCMINYWIVFETIEVECPPPTNFNVSFLSASSAELSWTAGGSEVEWEVAVVPANDPEPASGTVVNITDYTATNLSLGSSYDAYVRAVCGVGSVSVWNKITFTLDYCTAGPTSAIDSDLFRVQITGPGVNFDHNVGCTGILGVQDFTGLGAIQLQQGVEYTMTLTMGQCGSGTYTNVGKAWADWDQNVVFAEPDERLGVVQGATSSTGVEYSFNFVVPLGAVLGETQLRVMQYETSNQALVLPCATYSWGSVHDYLIEVTPAPPCPAPIDLTTVSTTSDGAEVSWTSAATEFEIEYGIAPYAFTGTANITGIMANYYTFTMLDPATTYQYKVKAICGVGDESEWSALASFTTKCEPFDLPWCEDFDDVTAPVIPQCMTVTNDNNDGILWATYAINPNSAPNAMAIQWNSDLAMDDWFFSPGLNLEAGVTYNVEFNYRAQSAFYPEALEVLWGTGPDAAGMTGGLIWDNDSIINTTYELASATFTPGVTGVYYVGWHGYSEADMFRLYVDDICIEEQPTVPENRTVDNVTIGIGEDECFDATNTITVTNTVVESGGIANFIAGMSIIFGDGFTVESGGYMWARIDNVYCNQPLTLLSIEDEAPVIVLPEIAASDSFFKVFPNPTTGNFKLELLGSDEADINVEIYGMMGEKVFQDRLFGSMLYEFDLSNMPKGIYFIRVLKGEEMGIEKVIKQ
jgi:hypothetical protein